MIWFFIPFAVAIYVAATSTTDDRYFNAGMAFIPAVVISLIILVILGLATGGDALPNKPHDIPIVTLSDGVGTQGGGSLFGFVMRTEGYFSYYTMNNNGGAKLRKVNAEAATIYQDGGENPYVTKQCYHGKTDWYWWGVSIGDGYTPCTYEFHITPRSIVEQYQLDAQ